MLSINIICVGKLKEQYLKDAVSEYSKRLSKYCKLNFIELSDEKIPDKINDSIAQDIKNKEANKIINSIKKDSFVFTLDLKGKWTNMLFKNDISTSINKSIFIRTSI